MWKNDFDNFDDIKMKQVGYPDLLHYKKGDKWTVQSYWEWSGKSKKSGEVETIMIVMFDEINKDGKIAREYNVGDFSKVN